MKIAFEVIREYYVGKAGTDGLAYEVIQTFADKANALACAEAKNALTDGSETFYVEVIRGS